MRETEHDQKRACAYLHFEETNDNKPLTESIWATLLLQLLPVENSLVPLISNKAKEKYYGTIHRPVEIDKGEYFELFQAQVEMFSTVHIILDGLDYLATQDQNGFEQVKSAIKQLPRNVWILWTARDDSFGRDIASKRVHVKPQRQDVQSYIQSRIQEAVARGSPLRDKELAAQVKREVSNLTLETGVSVFCNLSNDLRY